MKVGILTFQRAQNYGALFQAYALQTIIHKLGFTSELIDYRHIGEKKNIPNIKNGIRAYIHDIFYFVIGFNNNRVRNKRFSDFKNQNLVYSKEYYPDTVSLNKILNIYDTIITGSDQVWNPNITNSDMSYFLDFVDIKTKKVSYSPSFGVTVLPQNIIPKITLLLNQIDFLSIREAQGQQIIRELCNRNAQLVLDPTLLLTNKDWDNLLIKLEFKKPYIFCYALGDQPRMMDLCYYLKDMTGYPIVKIGSLKDKSNKNIIFAYSSGPREFLSLIKEAEIVVTNSYHGTILSIIYEKPFYTIPTEGNIKIARNSRLLSILTLFQLEDRIFSHDSHIPAYNNYKICYEYTRTKLLNERVKSIDFLRKSLSINA